MLLLEHLEYTCVNRKSPGIICHNPVLKNEKEKKKMVLCALRSTSPIGSSIRLPLPGSQEWPKHVQCLVLEAKRVYKNIFRMNVE